MLQQLKVIISGGGTGGHIFPAIAIANALKKRIPDIDILFVGAKGKMEMEKVPAAGYKIEALWISGLQRKLTLKNLLFPIKLIVSILKARRILKKFNPDVVVGVGGYASGPMLRVATTSGVPTLIQEQNSYPGITNRVLAKKVQKICVAYQGMEKYFPKEKIILTGNPVRQDIQNLEGKKPRALEFFNLNENKPVLLVIGGSLGAKTINESIHQILPELIKNNIQLIWQTGKTYFEKAKEAIIPYHDKGILVFDFIAKMDYAYAAADLVVSRAGASSVSELCIVQKPCILIPSPNVAEDHQTKNAMALVNYNAAVLVKDAEAKEKLKDEILRLMNTESEREKLAFNISKLALNNAADIIAAEVINLAVNKK
jgi:UDP-N-acetylglucosamine--N-acetylmuramyl-(pentapeptide) pyrophosphoryl-undecaprenol N-acetylglucosamine transferase